MSSYIHLVVIHEEQSPFHRYTFPLLEPERSNKFISKHNFTENTLIMEKLLIATEMVLLCGCKHLLHPASRKKNSGTISPTPMAGPWSITEIHGSSILKLIIIDLMMTDLGHS